MKSSRMVPLFLSCFLILTLVLFPDKMLLASSKGLSLWGKFVFPSLFPFLTATNLLIALGIPQQMGKFLQPLMKPLFGLNGIAAFPFVLGLLSGYPMGAKITASLWEEGLLSDTEVDHILTFCNNPGPLFVIGTVGTAFLQNPYWGYTLFLCIFLGSLTNGLFFRIFLPKKEKRTSLYVLPIPKPQPLGLLLSQAIKDAISTLLQVGGFIVLFSVFLEGLCATKILSSLILLLGKLVPFSTGFLQGFFGGILEMTNGCSLLSKTPEPFFFSFLAILFLLSFGGISILAQTLGILEKTPIHPFQYIFAKIMQSFFSVLYGILLFPFFENHTQKAVPAFSPMTDTAITPNFFSFLYFLFLFFVIILARNQTKP